MALVCGGTLYSWLGMTNWYWFKVWEIRIGYEWGDEVPMYDICIYYLVVGVCLSCGQYIIPWSLKVGLQGLASVVGT